MNILLCNDDGINSEGIIALALMLLKRKHNVTVVAPMNNCSGFAHSVSFYKDIEVEERKILNKIEGYALSGTPADCVKYGLSVLNKDFDVVIGGINLGSNLGTEIHYSGTVAIGLEGNILGYKSVTFSCPDYKNCHFERASEICVDVLEKYYEKLSDKFTLNVNIPAIKMGEKEKGYKITPLGSRFYTDIYEFSKSNVFQLTGEPVQVENPVDCDVALCDNGYITLTPIMLEQTDFKIIKMLKGE